MKVPQQFRLSIEMIELLKIEMKKTNESKTAIIERALREYFFKK